MRDQIDNSKKAIERLKNEKEQRQKLEKQKLKAAKERSSSTSVPVRKDVKEKEKEKKKKKGRGRIFSSTASSDEETEDSDSDSDDSDAEKKNKKSMERDQRFLQKILEEESAACTSMYDRVKRRSSAARPDRTDQKNDFIQKQKEYLEKLKRQRDRQKGKIL